MFDLHNTTGDSPESLERFTHEEVERILDHFIAITAVSPSVARHRLTDLSKREREVLGCMVEGLATAEIAAKLGCSPRTIQSHQQKIYQALGVNSALRAVFVAFLAECFEETP